jgi:oligopeptide/dipeptide ABC transporter ATP-binding protein
MSQRVAVMYLGRIVELTTSQNLYRQPAHPYTKMLLAAIPHASAQRRIQSKVTQVQGEIPSPIDRPKGCAFHTRCPYAVTRCREEDPALKEIAVQHVAACHLI